MHSCTNSNHLKNVKYRVSSTRGKQLSLHRNRPTPVGPLHRGQGPSQQDWGQSESTMDLTSSALTSRELPFG